MQYTIYFTSLVTSNFNWVWTRSIRIVMTWQCPISNWLPAIPMHRLHIIWVFAMKRVLESRKTWKWPMNVICLHRHWVMQKHHTMLAFTMLAVWLIYRKIGKPHVNTLKRQLNWDWMKPTKHWVWIMYHRRYKALSRWLFRRLLITNISRLLWPHNFIIYEIVSLILNQSDKSIGVLVNPFAVDFI